MTAPQIELTARAAKRINAILASEKAGVMRISVEGGGCSGFSYKFDLDQTPTDDDTVLELDGAKVAIDSASLPFLADCTIDFADDLIGATFKIENPHATAACGCGVSFSI